MTAKNAKDGGELRRRFLDAALEILEEPDTSLDLRKVAERAGKSRTAPYLAFGKTDEGGGLEALQLAVAAEGFGKLADRMDRALRSSRTSEEGLRGLATAYLAFAQDEPRLFRLMFGPNVGRALDRPVPSGPGLRERKALRDARARTEFVILQAIGMETGGYLRRHGSLDPSDLAGAVWAMLHGVAMLTIDGQWDTTRLGRLDDPEELASRTLRFLTTASSEAIEPARRALMEALEEKEMQKGERGVLEVHSEGPVAVRMDADRSDTDRPDAERLDADRMDADQPNAERMDADRLDEVRELAVAPLAFRRSEPDVLGGPRTYDSSAIRRARGLAHLAEGARLLWIDDAPERSAREAAVFEALGMEVVRARRTGEALAQLEGAPAHQAHAFDVIISDIARGEAEDRTDEGVRALPLLLEASPGIPVIFYVGTLRPGFGAPPGSFGITNDPEELVHLVFDALERGRV